MADTDVDDNASLKKIVLQLQRTVAVLETKLEMQQGEIEKLRDDRPAPLPAEEESSTQEGGGEQEEDQDVEVATAWRVILWMGGLTSSGFEVAANFVKDPESAVWGGLMFWPFSITCLFSLVPTYAKIVETRRGKCTVGFIGILWGLPAFLGGLALMADEDDETSDLKKNVARIILSLGAVSTVTSFFTFNDYAANWSALPQEAFNKGLLNLIKSLPKASATLLYLSTTSLKCIFDYNPNAFPVYERCSNPIFPSFCILFLASITWQVTFFGGPTKEDTGTLTWYDILKLNMPVLRGTQLIAFGACSTLALVLFSLTDIGGAEIHLNLNSPLFTVLILFVFSIFIICWIEIYEAHIHPLIYPHTATTRDDSTGSSSSRSASASTALDMRTLDIPIGGM
ncbi:hypothetical protein TrST_g11636 [Triparma strigata]|uniref:Uncharacterized protein n=1 Tax=Triparma strigata TaxID=1606541 RepID=A0A9W7BDD7_9STRA|nr:hypothetical protein TrST_g11636 [Triparma strigata]